MLEEERDSLCKPYVFGPDQINDLNEFLQQYRYRAEFWYTSPFGDVEKVVLGYSDDIDALRHNITHYGDYEYYKYAYFVKDRVYERKTEIMFFTIIDTFEDVIYKDVIKKTKTESPEKLTKEEIRNNDFGMIIKRRI